MALQGLRRYCSAILRILDRFVQHNGSVILMLSAQVCSVVLATAGRILRTGNADSGHDAMGTSEILLTMMAISMILTWLYVYIAKIPDAPLGRRDARPLLIVRGIAGFFGIWGFYFSVGYMDLAEATVINFVAPMLATLLLCIVGGQRASPVEMLAGSLSMLGVVLALEPWSVHPTNTALEHAMAIAMALVGVIGGAGSYVAISLLGKRVHPILTVAYFTTIGTVLNGLVTILQQRGHFHLPSAKLQWALLCLLGIISFVMHCLIAASLTWNDESGRALRVVHMQIVFAILADKLVWNVSPDVWRGAGAILVLFHALFTAFHKGDRGYILMRNEAEKSVGEEFVLDEH